MYRYIYKSRLTGTQSQLIQQIFNKMKKREMKLNLKIILVQIQTSMMGHQIRNLIGRNLKIINKMNRILNSYLSFTKSCRLLLNHTKIYWKINLMITICWKSKMTRISKYLYMRSKFHIACIYVVKILKCLLGAKENL